jgi:CBS domain-containing protein
MEQVAAKARSKPVVSVAKTATVLDASKAMVERNVGAAIVLEEGRLVGIFTERDVLKRVVTKQLNPETTPVAEVMTKNVVTVREDADRSLVLRLMNEHHVRHLPVVDAQGRVVSVLSMRQLLRAAVQDLEQTVWQLVAETAIDGAGG